MGNDKYHPPSVYWKLDYNSDSTSRCLANVSPSDNEGIGEDLPRKFASPRSDGYGTPSGEESVRQVAGSAHKMNSGCSVLSFFQFREE